MLKKIKQFKSIILEISLIAVLTIKVSKFIS